MTLHRSALDWGLVIEIFGYSPRSGLPDTHIYTFASALIARKGPSDFVNLGAYDRYISSNPYNESHFVFPIEEGDWLDSEQCAIEQRNVTVRGKPLPVPSAMVYKSAGVQLSAPPRIAVFEFCRALAAIAREDVLATPAERISHLHPEMFQLLQLEEWNHPDVVDDENRPSNSQTFKQLAEVLVHGDTNLYRVTAPPNTHWSNWPEGGSL
jgi:hypothetical protein